MLACPSKAKPGHNTTAVCTSWTAHTQAHTGQDRQTGRVSVLLPKRLKSRVRAALFYYIWNVIWPCLERSKDKLRQPSTHLQHEASTSLNYTSIHSHTHTHTHLILSTQMGRGSAFKGKHRTFSAFLVHSLSLKICFRCHLNTVKWAPEGVNQIKLKSSEGKRWVTRNRMRNLAQTLGSMATIP